MMPLVTRSLVALACVLAAGAARAEGTITIKDTSGYTRAASAVQDNGTVQFALANASGEPASGVSVALTNEATHQVFTSQSLNGVAAFEQIPPGSWVVASSTADVTFTDVAIVDALAPIAAGAGVTGLETAALVGGGAAAATGTAVAVNDATQGSGPDLSDEPLPLSPVD